MTKENWIKSPWTISIGTGFFSFILTIIYDYSKEKPILTTIWMIFKWVGNFVWKILNSNVKVFWFIIAIALITLFFYIIDKFKKEKTQLPDFYSYKEDKLKKWKWSWNWIDTNSNNVWRIVSMKAHCPNCDTPMIDNSSMYGLNFNCPRCEFDASNDQCDDPRKIERIILDNINRKKENN